MDVSPVADVGLEVMNTSDAFGDLLGLLVDGADEVADFKRARVTEVVEEHGHILLPFNAAIVAEDVCRIRVEGLGLIVFRPGLPATGEGDSIKRGKSLAMDGGLQMGVAAREGDAVPLVGLFSGPLGGSLGGSLGGTASDMLGT